MKHQVAQNSGNFAKLSNPRVLNLEFTTEGNGRDHMSQVVLLFSVVPHHCLKIQHKHNAFYPRSSLKNPEPSGLSEGSMVPWRGRGTYR